MLLALSHALTRKPSPYPRAKQQPPNQQILTFEPCYHPQAILSSPSQYILPLFCSPSEPYTSELDFHLQAIFSNPCHLEAIFSTHALTPKPFSYPRAMLSPPSHFFNFEPCSCPRTMLSPPSQACSPRPSYNPLVRLLHPNYVFKPKP